MSNNSWYKNNPKDKIWWKDTPDCVGEWVFSFDRVKEYNMFADYPHNLTAEEVEIFDRENPHWAEFFKERRSMSYPINAEDSYRAMDHKEAKRNE